jgi:hypothetical protein
VLKQISPNALPSIPMDFPKNCVPSARSINALFLDLYSIFYKINQKKG